MANGKPTTQAGEATTVNYGWVEAYGRRERRRLGQLHQHRPRRHRQHRQEHFEQRSRRFIDHARDGRDGGCRDRNDLRAGRSRSSDRYIALCRDQSEQLSRRLGASYDGAGPYAPLASPVLTGNPTAPTPTSGDNDTQRRHDLLSLRRQSLPRPVAMGDNPASSTATCGSTSATTARAGRHRGFTVDRWVVANLAGVGTWGRNLNAITGPSGFPYYHGFQSSSAHVSAATDAFSLYQAIEADAISDFAWGTSNGQPITLSFWAYSSLTGTFSGAIKNYAQTRSYPFTYSIPTANTWTKIVITIPGDTAGTWVMSGNGGAAYLFSIMGNGANARGPANAWTSASYNGATGAVSIIAVNGAALYLTGVKLEVGAVATPFNRQSLAKEFGRLPEVLSIWRNYCGLR